MPQPPDLPFQYGPKNPAQYDKLAKAVKDGKPDTVVDAVRNIGQQHDVQNRQLEDFLAKALQSGLSEHEFTNTVTDSVPFTENFNMTGGPNRYVGLLVFTDHSAGALGTDGTLSIGVNGSSILIQAGKFVTQFFAIGFVGLGANEISIGFTPDLDGGGTSTLTENVTIVPFELAANVTFST